VKDSIKLYLI